MSKRKISKRVDNLFQEIRNEIPADERENLVPDHSEIPDSKPISSGDNGIPAVFGAEKVTQIDLDAQGLDYSDRLEDLTATAAPEPVAQSSTSSAVKEQVISESLSKKISGLNELLESQSNSDLPEEDRQLVSEITNQLELALENAQLYAQVQQELEERTRAQQEIIRRNRDLAAVTSAVATLTELGTRALPNVLKTLGDSTRADRVYYSQVREDESGTYWRAVQEWINPDSPVDFDKKQISRLAIDDFPSWANELQKQSWIGANVDTSPEPESKYFSVNRLKSTAWIAVPGRTSMPNYIAFDFATSTVDLKPEDISAYRVVADGLSNTFTREALLEQLQLSLDETENLYNASHRLAVATDLNQMVEAIAQALVVPALNRGVLLSCTIGSNQELLNLHVVGTWFSGRGNPPLPVGSELKTELYKELVIRTAPEFFDDINNIQITPELQNELSRQHVGALVVMPLLVGRRQIGALLLEYEDRHHFGNRELRSYPPLADQLATLMENLRLFQQTQDALSETELLYKISSGVSQANTASDLVDLVNQNAMPKQASGIILGITVQDRVGIPTELEVIAAQEIRSVIFQEGATLTLGSLPLLQTIHEETIAIPNLESYAMIDDTSKKTLLEAGVKSLIIVPLRSAGKLSGLLITTSNEESEYSADEVRLLNLAAGGISVAIERQRLLREAQRRALELQTAAEIARDTTGTLSLDQLLKRFVEQIQLRFSFYHVAIFLLDQTNQFAVIREATGDSGTALKSSEYKFAVGHPSIIGQTTALGEPVIVNDTSTSELFVPNTFLSETKSEIGIPLKFGGRVTGALNVHANVLNAFTQNEVAVLQLLVDQIAIAIENARAFELSQKAVEELHEIDRIKTQFIANMSHELRTPLNSIIGFSRVILKGIDGPINETQSQDLAAIYNSGQHLLNLINNILDISKIEAGKMELQFTEISIVDVINSAMSTAAGLIKDKPIKLEQVVPPDLPTVRADHTRIGQVLINLVSNAVKFTDSGSITIEAKTSESPTGRKEILVTVTDTGSGIDSKDLGKLFQPFSQVDDSPTRKAGGTGLGLSISRSIIEMHQGRIGLEYSEPGRGSRFFFTLPVPETKKKNEPSTYFPEGNTILAIDDNPDILSLYERYLKPQGFDVFSLTDPLEALDTAKRIKPFAILVDIMMPQKDGWTVIRDLKDNPETQLIPIIIASIVEEKERGIKLGVADYLVKPFLQEDLVNAVKRINISSGVKNLLIIDDDATSAQGIQKMFDGNAQYSVTIASTGREGLEEVHASHPDIIILDLFLKDIDGFTLFEMLQSDPSLTDIPILFLSDSDLTPIQSQLISQFGQTLLSKGMLKEEILLPTLNDALLRHGMKQK